MKYTFKKNKLEKEMSRHKVFMRSLIIMFLSKFITIIQRCDDEVIPEFNSIDDLDKFYIDLTKGKYWLKKGFYLPRLNRNNKGIVRPHMKTIDGLLLNFRICKAVATIPVSTYHMVLKVDKYKKRISFWDLFKPKQLDKEDIVKMVEELFITFLKEFDTEELKQLIREAR